MRDAMLIVHFIGLSMALGTGFSNLFLASSASKLEQPERGSFMMKVTVLVRMGQVGLGLLLVSGFYLITPFWRELGDMPFLIAKLCMVGLLIVMVSIVSVMAKKAKQQNNPAMLLKVKPFGMVNFFLGIAIVILAVLSFH